MRGLIGPLKTVALAALAAAGLLMASGLKVSDPPNASVNIEAAESDVQKGEDLRGGVGGSLGEGH